ncbi:hypothetical protein K450DRAFT_222172 [Umbelopsis ramanniana AG]|uniref:Uncharacterized protein n=1 Tax=Umbelopsis ramanniana AG TaxID=1314678 RepID=A0AAD5EGZ6_UMBRA|nr:uncharacterized protein K450DRAFT_222172 [Umbelopsis ramanniana AG]KAI8583656.1 hypothetical protein K450DRAFT_222172 [Umbelopsis ramanniana AG]
MIELSDYGVRVVARVNLVLTWMAVLVCVRNAFVCYGQWKRTRGLIHVVNLAQVLAVLIHRTVYGLLPIFEVMSCAIFPFLVSMWHIAFLLMYTVMLLRVLVICDFKYNRAITIIALCLLLIRFADWPFELAYRSIVNKVSSQTATDGQTCWASWGTGVVILNFIGDLLANLFLSGLFLIRLYQHYKTQKGMTTTQNPLVGIVVRKSLLCFILTFIVNLIMNILKISLFLGNQSDALTVFFEIIESTLLVEALRFEPEKMGHHAYCQNCGMIVDSRQYRHRQSNHYLNEPPAHPDMLPDFPLDVINGLSQDKRRSSVPSFLEEGSITGLSTPNLSEGSSTPTLPSQWNNNADTKPQ